MSIKEVDVMPLSVPEQRRAYRQRIRNDITEAINKRIEKFEFEGDYNWKYLSLYAREEAEYIFRTTLYMPAAQEVKKVLKEKYEANYIFPTSSYEYRGKYIRIINRKEKDRNHVFAKINYKFASNFYEVLLSDTQKKYDERSKRERK